MAYEIGYRRPPPSSQFKKGTSGNPKGRPKGSKNFLTLLEQELAHPVTINENGRRKTVTRLQAMAKRLVAGAMQGDVKQLLILLEILRKSGGLDDPGIEGLLPVGPERRHPLAVPQRRAQIGVQMQSDGGEARLETALAHLAGSPGDHCCSSSSSDSCAPTAFSSKAANAWTVTARCSALRPVLAGVSSAMLSCRGG